MPFQGYLRSDSEWEDETVSPAPGEEIRLSRSTVQGDRLTISIHRPNEMDQGRHLAGAATGTQADGETLEEWTRRIYEQAKRTANNDNR